jgi:hypothetical protein
MKKLLVPSPGASSFFQSTHIRKMTKASFIEIECAGIRVGPSDISATTKTYKQKKKRRITMATQGGLVTWTINKFYVVEPAGADTPAEVIPLSAPFDVRVDFDGSGGAWQALENAAAKYEVKFYAEGIGLNAKEIDLGTVPGTLGSGPYTRSLTTTIDTEGVYRLGCLIRISPPSNVVGFEENLLISVSQQS